MKSISDTEPRAYVRHLRACGYCLIPGGRDWAAHHGIDWADFLRNGIPVATLQAIPDFMAENVVKQALREHTNGQ